MAGHRGNKGVVESRAVRSILHLFDVGDPVTARAELTELMSDGALSPSAGRLLEGLTALLDRDQPGAAARIKESLDIDPRNALAHYCLARLQATEGRTLESCANVDRALAIDPELADGWFFRSSLAFESRDFNAGMKCLLQAIRCDIDNAGYWGQLNQWLPRLHVVGHLPDERALLSEALQRQKIEIANIDQLIYSVLSVTPAFEALLSMAEDATLHGRVQRGEALAILDDDFLRLILLRTRLCVVRYERALTELRRALLAAIAEDSLPAPMRLNALRLTAALAVYAQNTGFVFYSTDTEAAQLRQCRERLRHASRISDQFLLSGVIGCYELLAEDEETASLLTQADTGSWPAELQEMVDRHIAEPRKIEEYQRSVGRFGSIRNDISRAVQQQYEVHPYPRWRFLGTPLAMTANHRIRLGLPHLRPNQQPRLQSLPSDALDILIAGCGTGRNALWCARGYPNTRILAIDLSRASLAYAMMKAGEFGMGNIEFLHGDLLDLPEIGRQFDLIEALGVLHHLEDPAAGLSALVRCLRPGGWMKIALYSLLGRRPVSAARQRIASLGISPTADGIREFRHLLMRNEGDPLGELCARWRDFFSLPECRDLLFHVQEHQFTTQGLEELFATAGVEFMGFEVPTQVQPDITNEQDLRQWGEFEEKHPDFFGSMYEMWLRRPG